MHLAPFLGQVNSIIGIQYNIATRDMNIALRLYFVQAFWDTSPFHVYLYSYHCYPKVPDTFMIAWYIYSLQETTTN